MRVGFEPTTILYPVTIFGKYRIGFENPTCTDNSLDNPDTIMELSKLFTLD